MHFVFIPIWLGATIIEKINPFATFSNLSNYILLVSLKSIGEPSQITFALRGG